MNKNGCTVIVIGLFACFFLCFYGIYCWIIGIQFEQNVSGHLKRAADANTVILAKEELQTALSFMEKNNMTSGSTHIIYQTPECDVGFWYKNIKSAYDELSEFPSNADHLTISNQLMKLRETLLDHSGESGDIVTIPPRIIYYPNHQLFCWGGILLWGAFAGGCVVIVVGCVMNNWID